MSFTQVSLATIISTNTYSVNKQHRENCKNLTCLRRSLMIAAHVSMMVLVNLGAGETPSAGLREGLINCGRRTVHELAR